ncbi:hypothetical protein BDZ45DRAFT_769348 [Acephala macrosclerotiorum]|nr:hypothetical protein BDZ45DRAFT_769348 [Acephala macrosclerotiorum]
MEVLVALLPGGCTRFGKKLIRLNEYHNHVELTFSDGSTTTADAVVDCNGMQFVVCELLLGKEDHAYRAVFSGMCCYRGLLEMKIATEAVGEELSLNSQVYMGKDEDLVNYPIGEGTVLNIWVVDNTHEDLMQKFEGFGEVPKRILKILALFGMPNAPRYTSKIVALLGDAAHASASHVGASAGMVVEDTLFQCDPTVLSTLNSDARVNSILDLPAVLAAYGMARRASTQNLVQNSRKSGILFQLRKPGIEDDIEKIKAELKDRQKWIWDIDMEDHLKNARARNV